MGTRPGHQEKAETAMNVRLFRLPLAIAAVITAFIFFTRRPQPLALVPAQAHRAPARAPQAPAPHYSAQQPPGAQAETQQGQTEQSDPADEDSNSSDAGTFHGYTCTVDCSGHEAGYNWAEEQGITDKDDCPLDPHNSHSFTEGCWAYADEQSGDDGRVRARVYFRRDLVLQG
jgi:hypothetical protein